MRNNHKIREMAHICIDQVCDLLEKKQKDYGDSMFFDKSADVKLTSKLSIKTDRLMNLALSGANPANEPVQDTLMDILGYVILKLANDRGYIYPDPKEKIA